MGAPHEQFIMDQPGIFQCWDCYWYIGGMKCRAFNMLDPNAEIPVHIMSGGIKHDHPIEGDNGRQWVYKHADPPPEDW